MLGLMVMGGVGIFYFGVVDRLVRFGFGCFICDEKDFVFFGFGLVWVL